MRTQRKFLAWMMTFFLLASVIPAAALATKPEDENGKVPPVCAGYEVDESCPAETHVEGCPLYVEPEEPADSVEDEPDDMTNDVNEPTIEEQLAALIAALPAPDEIDPEDEEQVEKVYDQISEIYAFAKKNGLDVEDNETINVVIAALYPAEPLDAPAPAMSGNCGATESDNVTWALTVNNDDSASPTYTLTISGSGVMADYELKNSEGKY